MIARLLAAVARALAAPTVFWTCGPPRPAPRIYFANHTSHLDFMVLWCALPPRLRAGARPVAARDYWEGGPIRRLLAGRVFRAILIDRRPEPDTAHRRLRAKSSIEEIVSQMGPHDSLIVFPEGTRGPGPEPRPFRSGLYHLCRARPDLELVPVYLGNLARILPKGATVPSPKLSRVVFGGPMRLEREESKSAFLERARLAVCALREQRTHRRRTDEDGIRVHQTLGIARLVLTAFRHRRPALRRR